MAASAETRAKMAATRRLQGEQRLALMEATGLKSCSRCNRELPLADFYGPYYKKREDGTDRKYYLSECLPCTNDSNIKRHAADPRARGLKAQRRRYGIDIDELTQAQGHPFCAICGENIAKCVDHDHATGEVRGALCRVCNMVLSYFENNTWKQSAEAYLKGGDDRCA